MYKAQFEVPLPSGASVRQAMMAASLCGCTRPDTWFERADDYLLLITFQGEDFHPVDVITPWTDFREAFRFIEDKNVTYILYLY